MCSGIAPSTPSDAAAESASQFPRLRCNGSCLTENLTVFKRLICGVPALSATDCDRSLKRGRSGTTRLLFVAGRRALLVPALLLPLLSGCSDDSVETPVANNVSAVTESSRPLTNRLSQGRAVLELNGDDFSPVDDSRAIEVSSDNFVALADDDATFRSESDDAPELTGPFGCPRMSSETRVAVTAAPKWGRSRTPALPLPEELSGSVPELPELPELQPDALVETVRSAEVTVSVIAESTLSDLPSFDDEPAPAAKKKVNAGPIQLVAALAAEDVKQLVVRARLELAAGDVLLAHRFAEAAAEVPIPLELFQQRPIAVLDEIEFTNQVRNAVLAEETRENAEKTPVSRSAERPIESRTVAAAEPPGLPDKFFEQLDPSVFADDPRLAQAASEKPAASDVPVAKPKGPRPTERIKRTPRAFQAIGQASLNVQPRFMENDGQSPRLPESEARKLLAQLPTLEHTLGTGRNWGSTVYSWDAPSFYHSPLYFEDVQLERYGNEIAFVQPVISGVHFLKDAATLPYQMGIEGNCPIGEVYDLGHDRPGDCVRYSWQRLPWSTTGALTQAGAVLGLIFIVP